MQLLGKPGITVINWARTHFCQPELYFEPEATEEIKQILTTAQEKGKKVKVVGVGHSLNDIAFTTDYLISLVRYNRVLKIDRSNGLVHVQGGCKMKYLNETILPENGLAFSVLPIMSDVTAAGVISTGSHGTGANMGIMSSYVTEIELMTASGEVIIISKVKNSDLLPAVCLSLGSLGIILSVTFQCELAFNLHQIQNPDKLQNVLADLDNFVSSCEHFHFFYFPYTDNVLRFHVNRTSKERSVVKSSWFWDTLVGYYMFTYLYWIGSSFTFLIPVLNSVFYNLLFNYKTERIDRGYNIFTVPIDVVNVFEWAIPSDKIGSVLADIKNWIVKNKFPALIPVDIRFVRGDDIMLSTANGWKTACYINILVDSKNFPSGQCWAEFEKIMSNVGGRPHWAKNHTYGREELINIYPQFDKFSKIRKRFDPNGMFLNSHLEKIFG